MVAGSTPLEARVPDDERLGARGLSALFAALYLVQGITEPTEGLVAQPVMSLLKNWGYDALGLGAFSLALAIPWFLKPVWGLISDLVPLAGYHRRSYMIGCGLVACAGFTALGGWPLEWQSTAHLFALLLPVTVAVAFADVVTDALMVEKGQPRGLTGRFQSMQWGAIYAATIVTGALGGYLSTAGRQHWAFAICAALSGAALLLILLAVSDRRATSAREDARAALTLLRSAGVSRPILLSGLFLFLWSFNPFALNVLYLHLTEAMGLAEQTYGNLMSIEALAAMVGSLAYAAYCRHVPLRWLLHAAVALGVASTASYWLLAGERSAQGVVVLVGFATATATVIQLDLAARVCPPRVAGTLFALLMSLSNLGTSLSRIVGGWAYERMKLEYSEPLAFKVLVGIGALCTAACWLVLPWLNAPPAAQTGD